MRTIVVAGIVLLSGMGVLSCSKSVPTPAKPETPVASAPSSNEANPITEEKLGLPFYPGARLVGGRAQGKLVNADLETTDLPDRVLSFYAKELGTKAAWSGQLMSIDGTKDGSRYAVTVIAAKGNPTSISILGERK
ncbi:MAG: hypothetical protein ACHQ50_01000 [Fimbriimonadales bacterium]